MIQKVFIFNLDPYLDPVWNTVPKTNVLWSSVFWEQGKAGHHRVCVS